MSQRKSPSRFKRSAVGQKFKEAAAIVGAKDNPKALDRATKRLVGINPQKSGDKKPKVKKTEDKA